MIQELAVLADGFAGSAVHMRCFLHIINLVAKTLLRQFDVKKKDGATDMTSLDDETQCELKELEGLLIEDDEDAPRAVNDEGDDDSVEGWVDEMDEMSEVERRALEQSIRPVKCALAKVRASKLTSLWS